MPRGLVDPPSRNGDASGNGFQGGLLPFVDNDLQKLDNQAICGAFGGAKDLDAEALWADTFAMEKIGQKIGRRRVLKVMGVGTVGLAALAGACGGEEASQNQTQSGPGCNDPIDAASQQLRTSLQYKDTSDQPGKRCDNCAQFVAGAHGQCGGCNLFTGPVQPGGYCISWAPKS